MYIYFQSNDLQKTFNACISDIYGLVGVVVGAGRYINATDYVVAGKLRGGICAAWKLISAWSTGVVYQSIHSSSNGKTTRL